MRQLLFGRSDKTSATPSPAKAKEGGKGHPTPTRKEAQAAARERARAVVDKKSATKRDRARRASDSRSMRQGMRAGDERYLPVRDQGPVKRFVRDFVDARLCFAEFLLPLLIVIMVLSYTGNPQARNIGTDLWGVTLVLVLIDTGWLLVRMRRALRAGFPDEGLRGVNFYAVTRVIQMRFMRMPKTKVGIGGKPK